MDKQKHKSYFDKVGKRVVVNGRAGVVADVAVTPEGIPVYQELGGYFYIEWDDHGTQEQDAWEQKLTGQQLGFTLYGIGRQNNG